MTKGQFVLLTSVLTLALCAPIWPRTDTRPKLSYVSFQDLRSPRQSLFRTARPAKPPLARPPTPPAPAIQPAAVDKPRPAQAEAPARPDPAQVLRSRLSKAVAGLKPGTALAADRQAPPAKSVQPQAPRKAKAQPTAAKPSLAKPTAKKTGSPQAGSSRTG